MRISVFIVVALLLVSSVAFAATFTEGDLLFQKGVEQGIKDAKNEVSTMNLYGMVDPGFRLKLFRDPDLAGMNPLNFDMYYYLQGYRYGYYAGAGAEGVDQAKTFLPEDYLKVAKAAKGKIGTNVRGRYTSANLYSLSLDRRENSFELGYRFGLEHGKSRTYENPRSLFMRVIETVGPEGIPYRDYNGLDDKYFRKGYQKGYSNGLHFGKVTEQKGMMQILETSTSTYSEKDQLTLNIRGKY